MTLTQAQRSNFWPPTAHGYSWWRARSLSLLAGEPFSLAREKNLFLVLGRPQAGERWLDTGTSAGFYAGVLAEQGCEVDAVDISAAMLRVAAQRCASALIHWHQLNAEQAPWPAGTFDGITVGATLNETACPQRLLSESARLLRPGGRLWLMFVPRSDGPGQNVLRHLAGLTFPDLAWVERHLPDCVLNHAYRTGLVQFALFERL